MADSQKTELFMHPLRIRIMTEFAGQERTVQQIAQALPDVPQATLYRHIKKLVNGGILEVTRETVVNGAVERTLRVLPDANRLTGEDVRGATADDHLRYFSLYTATLIDTFSDYIHRADLDHVFEDGLSYKRTAVHLSAEERAQFEAELNAVISRMLACQPAPHRQRYTLASVVIPTAKEQS